MACFGEKKNNTYTQKTTKKTTVKTTLTRKALSYICFRKTTSKGHKVSDFFQDIGPKSLPHVILTNRKIIQ